MSAFSEIKRSCEGLADLLGKESNLSAGAADQAHAPGSPQGRGGVKCPGYGECQPPGGKARGILPGRRKTTRARARNHPAPILSACPKPPPPRQPENTRARVRRHFPALQNTPGGERTLRARPKCRAKPRARGREPPARHEPEISLKGGVSRRLAGVWAGV